MEEMTGVAEVAGALLTAQQGHGEDDWGGRGGRCSLTGRTFLEWSSQSYHMSAMYFNWIETTQEQQKARQSHRA